MLFSESQTLERTSFQPALWRRLAYVQQQLLATASVLQMLHESIPSTPLNGSLRNFNT